MRLPADIRFIGLEPSDALQALAREKVAKLDLFCPSIMGCRVAIELEHKHQHQGRPFSVRINLTLPGHELEASRVRHEDPYVALRDAFDDMKRQLEDAMRRMQEKRQEAAVGAPEPGEGNGSAQ